MHVTYMCVCNQHLCMCRPVCRCKFFANILYMCVSMALQQWRHRDTWHHTDVTQHSTLQWHLHERWGIEENINREWKKPNPTLAYSCTGFLQTVPAQSNLNKTDKLEHRYSRQAACSCTQINFYTPWGAVDICSSQKWPLWTLIAFTERREQLKTTSLVKQITRRNMICVCISPLGTVQCWGILMLQLLLAVICFCVHSASPLASPSFPHIFPFIFLVFFSKKYLLAELNSSMNKLH